MNRYGELAKSHWAEWLPLRYSEIENPEGFFEQMGEEVATEVESTYQAMLKSQPSHLSGQQAEAWASTARQNAEERVLSESVYLTPEATEEVVTPEASNPHTIQVQTLQSIYDEQSFDSLT